ncbi:MAG: hypothetical protein V7K88_13525 [Nostoc sp.]|uniref:hypothetical protein n=1 Tax=Nostoc sp. TaxID=1180 RepID=UPI002FF871E2
MTKINITHDNPEWFEWWVNPVEDGKPEADPTDLQGTQKYIEERFTKETQEKITIKVRPQRED